MLKERIFALLAERKMTIKEMGERLGWDTSKTSHNVSSKSPTLSTMEAIASGIGCEVWELLISREELIAERNRRLGKNSHQVVMTNIACPCCGKEVCLHLRTE